MGIRIAIIEDDARYRHSLEALFGHAADFSMAASFGSAEDALEEVSSLLDSGAAPGWDLVLMDLQLPGLGGIEATRRLKVLLTDVAIVILTVFEKPTTILEAISAGADGYLLKRAPADEILAQLRMISSGGAPLTAGVARTVLDLLRKTDRASREIATAASSKLFDLTEREHEVVHCLVRGMAYKQVAGHLGISIDTVRSHIRAIYKKLQVHSVAEAVVRAIREKLV